MVRVTKRRVAEPGTASALSQVVTGAVGWQGTYPGDMTMGGYEAAEARERLTTRILEAARARALAKASQVITTAAAAETKPLVLMIPGTPFPSDPGWADFWARFYSADLIARSIASDPASQHALEQVAASIRETGVRDDSSPMLLLLVVLMWLIAVGLPVVQAELPGNVQGIAINEVTTVGLALAITWRIRDKRNKGD